MTSDHHLVLTKLSTETRGTSATTPKKAKRATENNYPRVAGQPTPVLEKFAKHVAEMLKDNNRKWGSKLVNYDSLEELDALIANIIERIKEVGMKFLNKGRKNGGSNKEQKLRRRLTKCNKLKLRIKEIRTLGLEITPGHAKNLEKKIAAIAGRKIQVSNETLEELQEYLQKEYKRVRKEWRTSRKPTRDQKNKKLWNMDPHKLMANLLKETEKGEPHAVIDPVDGCLCTEGNRVKEIIKGALQG
jgi:hypothetical protein